MKDLTAPCIRYEICGGFHTFDTEFEYETYLNIGEDYICPECYDSEEFGFYETTGWADSDALASAGWGMDEDY